MKKIAFALHVSDFIIMFPLYIVLELGNVAKKVSKTNTTVTVTEKVEKPLKVFVKVKSQRNIPAFVNSFAFTVNTIKL